LVHTPQSLFFPAIGCFKATKKAGLEEGMSFGSPAISVVKIRGFPPPSRERLGFIGQHIFDRVVNVINLIIVG
jgi:hypothetical protein